MSVKIRLSRHGKTHKPFYHVIVTDSRNKRDGSHIEKLGYYDPNNSPSTINLKEDRVKYWYSKGAEVSSTVAKLLKIQKLDLMRDKTQKA